MKKTEWTPQAHNRLTRYLETHRLRSGIGDRKSPCSIQAINIALTGKPGMDTPNCMSETMGDWIIVVQDSIPDTLRNSQEWKELLSRAADTQRHQEEERNSIILEWMWDKVLPHITETLDHKGARDSWKTMIEERTVETAHTAAARAKEKSQTIRALFAWDAAQQAAAAIQASERQPRILAWVAAKTARSAATASPDPREFWRQADPVGLLKSLIQVKMSAR